MTFQDYLTDHGTTCTCGAWDEDEGTPESGIYAHDHDCPVEAAWIAYREAQTPLSGIEEQTVEGMNHMATELNADK